MREIVKSPAQVAYHAGEIRQIATSLAQYDLSGDLASADGLQETLCASRNPHQSFP